MNFWPNLEEVETKVKSPETLKPANHDLLNLA